MREITFRSRSLSDLPAIARSIIRESGEHRLLAFYGEMGAGKTTLIQSVCHALGVQSEVTSPTFALVNEYLIPGGSLFHFDFYRVNKVSEALDFGIEEYFDSGSWCLMEWPEKIEELLPEPLVRLSLQVHKDGSRAIMMQIPS
ncbi:MAG: tRNA (adenosine(37)-N6)-threonylcarbamoyltransferase complex ATPase subunit type 1 TsaE [Bacteroidota bacterium]